MFGRTKAAASQDATPVTSMPVKEGGKGRPTPKRREVEQRNRRPVIGATAAGPAPGATKAERRAARQAQKAAVRAERMQQRQAMMSGDERALPARDRGPARKFARDYVDSRRNAGEYFLYVALVAVMLSFLRPTALISMAVLYAMVLVVIVDSLLLRRRVQRMVTERFGESGNNVPGTGTYALMRALQLRRGRLPRPQVERGRKAKAR